MLTALKKLKNRWQTDYVYFFSAFLSSPAFAQVDNLETPIRDLVTKSLNILSVICVGLTIIGIVLYLIMDDSNIKQILFKIAAPIFILGVCSWLAKVLYAQFDALSAAVGG